MRIQSLAKALSSLLAGTSLLLAGAQAFALSVTGFSGKSPSNGTCFTESSGAAVNSCGSVQYWTIPMAVNQGAHTVTISAYNPSTGPFQCILYAASQTGSVTTGTSAFPGAGTSVSSMSVTVPASGSMWVFCQVDPGGIIYDVNYNQ